MILLARVVVSKNGSGDFTSIREATLAAAPGSEIFLRFGVYEEQIRLDKALEIRGEGAADRTVVRPTGVPAVLASARGLLTNMTLAALVQDHQLDCASVDICGPSEVELDSCVVAGNVGGGVHVYQNGVARLRACKITGAQQYGLIVWGSSRAEVSECEFTHCGTGSVRLVDGTINVDSCRLTKSGADSILIEGGILKADSCKFSESGGAGAALSNGVVEIRSSSIRDGRFGVWVSGGTALIEDCEIDHHQLQAVNANASGRVVVRRTQLHDSGNYGVAVTAAADVRLEECDVYGNLCGGIGVIDASLSAVDTRVHRSRPKDGGSSNDSTEANGSGIDVAQRSQIELHRCELTDNAGSGIMASYGAEITMVECHNDRNRAFGIWLADGSSADVSGGSLDGNRQGQTLVDSGSRLTADEPSPSRARPAPGSDDLFKEASDRSNASLADLLTQLDELTGLDAVKNQVRELVAFLRIQTMRKVASLPSVETSNP